jgi:hypothetical protein
VDATFFTNVAQVMRGYHETVAPLTTLPMVGRLVVAQAGNGVALVPLPIDYCVWTKAVERRLQELQLAKCHGGVAKVMQAPKRGESSSYAP